MARRRGGAGPLACLVVGLLCACTPSVAQEPGPATSFAPTPAASSAAPATAGIPAAGTADQAVPVQDATAAPPARDAAPVRLTIPGEHIDMAVVPVGVADDGSMALSPDAFQAGWYEYGPAPGDPAGNVVLAAHVDSVESGIGPFAQLRHVPVGAVVRLTSSDGTVHHYRVLSVAKIAKDEAPTASWFARDGAPRLLLVTCGGAWDAKIRHYADNVVVTAEPTGG